LPEQFAADLYRIFGTNLAAAKTSDAFAVCQHHPGFLLRVQLDCFDRTNCNALATSDAVFTDEHRPWFKLAQRLNTPHYKFYGNITVLFDLNFKKTILNHSAELRAGILYFVGR